MANEDNAVTGVGNTPNSAQDTYDRYNAYQQELDNIYGDPAAAGVSAGATAPALRPEAQQEYTEIASANGPRTFGASEAKDPGQRFRNGQVAEEVTVVMQTFIPYDTVQVDPFQRYIHGDGAHHTTPGGDNSYLDNQGFRTQQVITLQYDAQGNLLGYKDVTKRVGESAIYSDEAGQNELGRATASANSLQQKIYQDQYGNTIIEFNNETSVPRELVPGQLPGGRLPDIAGGGVNPAAPGAPGITNQSRVVIRPHNGPSDNLSISVGGQHDRFPAYEIVARRTSGGASTGWNLVHGSHPSQYGDGKYGIGPLHGLTRAPVPLNNYDAPPTSIPPAR